MTVEPTLSVPDADEVSTPPHPAEILLLEELSAWLGGEDASGLGEVDLGLAIALGSESVAQRGQSRRANGAPQKLLETLPYGEAIFATAQRHQLDGLLLAAVVETESSFNAAAVSPQGALGLMQVMPATAESLGVGDPRDPHLNLEAGTRYLHSLLQRFDGDLGLALAAYNAGPTAVARYGGLPPYAETMSYVEKVLRVYLGHRHHLWREASESKRGQEAPFAELSSLR